MKKKILYWLLGIVVLIVLILIGVSEYFIYYALHSDTSEYNIETEIADFKADYPYAANWMDSIRATHALKDTVAMNRDGKKIHAWYLASPDSTAHTAIIVHGYTSNPFEMMMIGYMYHHDFHWNILLPDLVAHGQSEGEWIQMSWKDRFDVLQWCRVARGIFPDTDQVIHGISMGAATTMNVSGEDTPDYIKAFVEDCGFSSVWDEYVGELKKRFGLPSFPILDITNIVSKIQLGWSFKEASPKEQVAKCEKPMLFIHGDNDDYVPTAMIHVVFDAKGTKVQPKGNGTSVNGATGASEVKTTGPKTKWLAAGSAHAESYKDHPEEYTQVVEKFLKENNVY